MSIQNCMICKDYCEDLYKVCSCVDSVLCEDCLTITNTTNMQICPICKRNLKIKLIKDYSKYCKLLVPVLFINLLSIFIPLIYPIHNLVNKYNVESLLVFIITLYSVLLLQPIISYRISSEFKFNHNKYLLYKSLLILCFIPLLFIFNSDSQPVVYLVICIIPFYILPNLCITLIDIIDKKNEFKNYLNNKTIIKQINFTIIHNAI